MKSTFTLFASYWSQTDWPPSSFNKEKPLSQTGPTVLNVSGSKQQEVTKFVYKTVRGSQILVFLL